MRKFQSFPHQSTFPPTNEKAGYLNRCRLAEMQRLAAYLFEITTPALGLLSRGLSVGLIPAALFIVVYCCSLSCCCSPPSFFRSIYRRNFSTSLFDHTHERPIFFGANSGCRPNTTRTCAGETPICSATCFVLSISYPYLCVICYYMATFYTTLRRLSIGCLVDKNSASRIAVDTKIFIR